MSMPEFHSLVVAAHLKEADDAIRLRLAVPPEARDAFRVVPGQHITVRMNVGEKHLRRTYTVVSHPSSASLELAIRVQGRVSRTLAESLRPGMSVEVLPPAGRFRLPAPSEGPAHYLGLAAGSGITPVYALTRELLETTPDARCTLVIGNQALARSMLVEDLLALKDRFLDRLTLHFVMSREPQEVEWLNGRLDRAWLTRAARKLFDPATLEGAMLCGPGSMIAELTAALQELGVPQERIHSERFTLERRSPSPLPPVRGEMRPADVPGAEVTVIMDGRRRTFTMPRDGTRILDAAERAGLALPYSCRDGICCTCRVKVIAGEVALGEQYALEPWEIEAGFTLACQAQPRSGTLTLSYDER
ncbi:MAG TPA: 2Fe-2S iron-sulfur cluster-binding protein [Steroidobacteraceae bacterium]|nr:2Fe-2S iron-sulfur cluster-binding protein [Steroidobacteraceae bacterium]